MLRILVVDDEAHNREALSLLIHRLGHECLLAIDGSDALEKTLHQSFDLVLTDIRMPRMDGLSFFEAAQRLMGAHLPRFVFMTAYGRIEDAVEALRKGALHFLSKPLKKKEIVSILEEVQKLKQRASHQTKLEIRSDPIYHSKVFGDVVQTVEKVAPSLASVLFIGESGTGKEILAKLLHQRSMRTNGPFIVFHAAAMPESLMESALFGHEKGAFTGADVARLGQIRNAHGGSFFLDEISSMPLSVQAKLLRVLQDRQVLSLGGSTPIEVDVRWISASNVELEPLVRQNLFREDLLYRLKVVAIEVPSLRERPEDIDVLTDYFMKLFSERESRAGLKITESVRTLLNTYSWPGNVRELQNVIERAVALATSDNLTEDLLPSHIVQSQTAKEIRIAVGSSLQSAEDKLIEETLKTCHGDKVQAAAILGVAPRTIYRWLERKQASLS